MGDHSRLFVVQTTYDQAMPWLDYGRWDEAERFAATVRGVPLEGDNAREYVVMRNSVEGHLAARDGRITDAIALAEAAVAFAAPSDRPSQRVAVQAVRAEVERAAGHAPETNAALAQAVELCEKYGYVAVAARVRAAFQ